MENAKWVLLLLLVTAIWGSTFALVKGALASVGTFTLLSVRFLLAAAVLAAYVIAAKKPVGRRELVGGAATGILLFVGYAAQTFGLNYISATGSAFITGLLVVFVPLFSALLLRRMPGRRVLVCVAVALAGLCLLTGAAVGFGIGEIATLVCAAAFGLEVLCIDRFVKGYSMPGLVLATVATVSILSLAAMLPLEGLPQSIPIPALASIAFLAVFATVLAQAGQMVAQTRLSPAQTALLLLAEPLFAALFGFLLLGETLDAAQWLGAMLMLAGMFGAGNSKA